VFTLTHHRKMKRIGCGRVEITSGRVGYIADGIVSTVIRVSKSRGTHEHIFLSRDSGSPETNSEITSYESQCLVPFCEFSKQTEQKAF
jgi:hypothetical protein